MKGRIGTRGRVLARKANREKEIYERLEIGLRSDPWSRSVCLAQCLVLSKCLLKERMNDS